MPQKLNLQPSSILFFALLVVLILQNSALCQVYSTNPTVHNFDDNTFVTVDEIFEEFKDLQDPDEENENGDYLRLTRHMFGYTLIAKDLNKRREIPKEKKNTFDLGIDLLNLDPQFKEITQYEVYVEIDGFKLWLPIQNKLYDIWETNVSKNDSVLIYTRIIGGFKASPENRWLLLITRFHESLQTILWNEGIASLNNGNSKIGERYLSKLIALYPKDAEAKASLAYHFTEKGISQMGTQRQNYFNKADSLFQQAENIAPDYGFQYFQKAILRYHQERFIDSWNLIEKAKVNGHTDIEEKFLNQLSSEMSFNEFQNQTH